MTLDPPFDRDELKAAPEIATVEIALHALLMLRSALGDAEPSALRAAPSTCAYEPAGIQIARTILKTADELNRWLHTYRQLLRLDHERTRLEAIIARHDDIAL